MGETVEADAVACACCGVPRPESEVVRLHCHEETAICGSCVHWLSARVHQRPQLTPILPVRDMEEAREFWLRTGVEVQLFDDGYAFVLLGGAEIAHLALHPDLDPAANAAAVYVHVDDADAWHARWRESGLPVGDVAVQPWGMLEFRVRDPSGNVLRVGRHAPE